MKDISSEYSAIRERALLDQRQRLAFALSKIDGLAAIEKRYAQLQADLALCRVSGGACDPIASELSSLEQKRAEMLLAHDLPEDFLSLRSECSICRDYGYTDGGVRCKCYERRAALRRNRISNLVGFETQTFEAFDENIFPVEDGQRQRMLKLRSVCIDYADAFPNNERQNLLLIGNSGLGKTYLLNCIGKRVLDRGYSVIKLTANHFHQLVLQEIIGNRNQSPMRDWENVDLLLFDDLGCEPSVSNIVEQHFFSLLNERSMLSRHIVIATNLSVDEVRARYGERTFSRLFDTSHTRPLQFKGKDVRLLKS